MSPHRHRKLFTKHKAGAGKAIPPPTLESIHRAKSLSSLVEVGLDSPRLRTRSSVPAPGALRPALSQSALHHAPASLSSMGRGAGQYRSSSALYEAATRREAVLLERLASPGPPSISSRLSAGQPEFSKRHPEQLESFQLDLVRAPLEAKPPPIYFEKSSNLPDPSEQHRWGLARGGNLNLNLFCRFEFLPRPCDPTTIPSKEDGEEARIASKDYRAVNATLGKALEKTRFNKVETVAAKVKKDAANEGKVSVRSFGLKKAPAPMPPILRK